MYRINIHSPRHRHNEEPEPVGASKGVEITKEEEKLNFLKTLYFIKGLLSIFLGLFSYYTYLHTRSDSILILSFTSFISLASAILGVVGCFKGIEDLKYRHLILAGEKEGIGKNFLMGSFSLML